MRITNSMMAKNVINNLRKNTERLVKAQEIVATEKLINRPSDDPIGMSSILSFRREISSVEQYNRNIVQGKMRIEITETTLNAIDDLIGDAKEIAVSITTIPGDTESRAIMASKVQEIHDQVLQLANSKFENNYLFAGFDSDKPAFLADGSYDGDSGDIYFKAGKDVQIKVNASGDDLFISPAPASLSVFTVLDDLKTALEAAPFVKSDVSNQISLLDSAQDQIDFVRSQMATKHERLEIFEEQLAVYKNKFEELLARRENADMARAIVEMQRQETAYEVSLASAARAFQKSLIDFL